MIQVFVNWHTKNTAALSSTNVYGVLGTEELSEFDHIGVKDCGQVPTLGIEGAYRGTEVLPMGENLICRNWQFLLSKPCSY
jgi:hypothetical protein